MFLDRDVTQYFGLKLKNDNWKTCWICCHNRIRFCVRLTAFLPSRDYFLCVEIWAIHWWKSLWTKITEQRGIEIQINDQFKQNQVSRGTQEDVTFEIDGRLGIECDHRRQWRIIVVIKGRRWRGNTKPTLWIKIKTHQRSKTEEIKAKARYQIKAKLYFCQSWTDSRTWLL